MDSKNIVFICGISCIGKSFITRQIRDLYIDEIEKVNVDALFLDQTREEVICLKDLQASKKKADEFYLANFGLWLCNKLFGYNIVLSIKI